MCWRRLVCLALVAGALGIVWAAALADTVKTKDGKIYIGAVDELGDKVRVTQEGGAVVILNRDEVEEIARTPLQEYPQREAQIKPGDAAGRLSLALWCDRNNLKTEAVRECAKALAIRPDHPAARELMLGLLRSSGTRTTTATDRPETRPVRVSGRNLLLEERPPTQKYFRLRVQSVLSKSCASAQCHGGRGAGKLRLKRTRIGGLATKDVYLPNFDAIYPYITDFHNPEKSLLLQHPLAVKEGGIPSKCKKVFKSRRDPQYRAIAELIKDRLLLPAPPKSGETKKEPREPTGGNE